MKDSRDNKVICFSIEALRKKWPPADEACLKKLIERCKNDEKAAWDELFERFIGLILKTINKTLEQCGRKDLINDPDVFQEINVRLVRKFICGRVLDNLRHALALPRLIEMNARHRTIGWLRKESRKKGVFIREMKESQVSLDAPMGTGDTHGTLQDVIGNGAPPLDDPDLETPRKLRSVRARIAALAPKERLLIRVLFIYYEGPRDRDIQRIARQRQIAEEQVTLEVNGLLGTLAEKALEREHQRGRETVFWHKLRKLETRRKDLSPDPLKTDELRQTEEKIFEIEKQLNLMRSRNRGPIRPTNRKIAEILGMNPEEARSISQKIFRIRKRLGDDLKKK